MSKTYQCDHCKKNVDMGVKNKMEEQEEQINVWMLLLVIVVIAGIVLVIHSFVYPDYDSSFQGYCNKFYGNNSFYNHLNSDTPYELRSCDKLENNTLTHNYFLATKDYQAWVNQTNSEYKCPEAWELNKWSCSFSGGSL